MTVGLSVERARDQIALAQRTRAGGGEACRTLALIKIARGASKPRNLMLDNYY